MVENGLRSESKASVTETILTILDDNIPILAISVILIESINGVIHRICKITEVNF